MLDSRSVITHAVNGHVKELAEELDVSLTRTYEMLGDQCHYPKAKRLIKAIAKVNQNGARLIKADMDVFFDGILEPNTKEVTDAEFLRELYDPIQARLDGKTDAERLQQCREAVAILEREIEQIEGK